MKVAFVVYDLQLSGGVSVILEHARRLSMRDGWDVTLVLAREQEAASWRGYEHLSHLHICPREQALLQRYDIAIATWWETTFTLFELDAGRYAYFVQSLEDRFYHHEEAERLGAGLTLDLPVAFITEARWIAQTLAQIRPDAPCYLVRNGIDKEVFVPIDQVMPSLDGPLRVLIEGSPQAWFKHVPAAVQAAAAMQEPRHLMIASGGHDGLPADAAQEVLGPMSHREMAEVYARTDVLLKLSSVEGMFGPPLEGFHRGATCVVTPVTGHEEYVEHGFNALLADWEDLRGTARQLDLLARDRELLHYLRCNALATAKAWPDWDQSSQFMAGALMQIADSPPPDGAKASARMLADLRAGLEIYRGHMHTRSRSARIGMRLERAMERLRETPLFRCINALRRFRIVQLAVRPLRPLARRARRLLS